MKEGRDFKTSIELPEALWRSVKHRAVDEGGKVRDVVIRALEAYLKTPLPKKGGGRDGR